MWAAMSRLDQVVAEVGERDGKHHAAQAGIVRRKNVLQVCPVLQCSRTQCACSASDSMTAQ